jgi:ATP-dependent helicase/nuclease subunit A
MTQVENDSQTPAGVAPSPTDQQQAAIDTKHVSIALSAGAGCGKTSVLTQRFLSHLEPGKNTADLSSLVAITFTERAAREMRERIRGQCLRRLRSCPGEEVEHWLAIVRALDSARISTIHSFCASLLRANAVEAGIDPAFGLLDETLGESFLRQSVEFGLNELLAANDADAAELVFEFGLRGTRERLACLVMQRYRIDFAKWEPMSGKDLALKWDRHWHADFVPELLAELASTEPAQRTLQLLGEHVPDHPVMQERRRALLATIPRLTEGGDPDELLSAIWANARVQGGGPKDDWESDEVYLDVKDVLADLRDRVDKLKSLLDYDPEHLQRGAEIGLCALRAAVKVGEGYDARKSKEGVLDFDDLLLGARSLLRDHEGVRRRMESGITLLMVDEFQDTDPIQEEIVSLLCGKSFLTGRLFVVGDAKQSIYRFRRADPKVFHDLRDRIDPAGRLPLNKNFRSQPEILAFVNAVFDGALDGEYEPLEPGSTAQKPSSSVDRAKHSQPARIEFLFATQPSDEVSDSEDTDGEGTFDKRAAARRRREGDWIAGRITQLLTAGAPVRDKQTGEITHRPVEPREIVILFRAMSDVRYYEEALRRHGVDYYVVGGRAFFAQQEIFDVVNLCQYLDDVDDEVALIGVLRSGFFSFSDDSIVALGSSLTRALAQAPPTFLPEQQQAQVRLAGKVLAELREQKDHLPISRLLLLAIERTGYDASLLTEFLGSRKLANLRKLIDMARQFDRSGLFTLADFVERLRDAVADETHEALAATHPESSNIVRLMSIHQSKGLEFPVVVVADLDRPVNSQLLAAHFDPELGPLVGLPPKFGVERDHPGRRMLRRSERRQDLAEARRVLYVAMTRAADLLILSANLKQADRPTSPWLTLIAERFDLLTGQPRHRPAAGGVSIMSKYASRWPEIHIHHSAPRPVAVRELTLALRRNPAVLQETDAIQQDGAVDAGPVKLDRLREAIDRSEPAPLPETLRVIEPDRSARRRFSVSEIEDIDEQIRIGTDSRAALKARREKRDDRGGELRINDTEISGDLPAAEQLGTLVHAVLERLDFRNPQEAQALLERFSNFSASPIDASVRTAAAACVANLVASPLGADLASARQIHREIDFLLRFLLSGRVPQTGASRTPLIQSAGDDCNLETQAFVISGTIDCLFESADGSWTVLDYKTGVRERSTPAAELIAAYEIQLGLYALAVREFLKRLPDRIELAFIRNGVDRVLFEPTESKLEEIATRVSRALAETRNARWHSSA